MKAGVAGGSAGGESSESAREAELAQQVAALEQKLSKMKLSFSAAAGAEAEFPHNNRSIMAAIEGLKATDTEDCMDAIAELSEVIDRLKLEESTRLGAAIRKSGGIQRVAYLLVSRDPAVVSLALWFLANLSSDSVDSASSETKAVLLECGAHRAIVKALSSDDLSTLVYATGLALNLSISPEWAKVLLEHGAVFHLEQLETYDDDRVVHYVLGTLHNIVNNFPELTRGGSSPATVAGVALSPRTKQSMGVFEQQRAVAAFSEKRASRKIHEQARLMKERLDRRRAAGDKNRRQILDNEFG